MQKKRHREIMNSVANWCTGSLHPLSIISGLIALLRYLEPGYNPPGRNTLAAVVRREYEDLRKVLISVLNQIDGITLTMHWRS